MDYDRIETDILVIGSGGAGLRAAIEAHDHGAHVSVVCKSFIRLSHTRMSGSSHQGGNPPGDSIDLFYEDIVNGGAGINNQKLARILASEALNRIYDLEKFGVLWNRAEPDRYRLTASAGHSKARKVATTNEGIEIVNTMVQQIYQRKVPFYEHVFVVDLLSDDGIIAGAICLDMRKGRPLVFSCKAIVMASGGAPELYRINSGPIGSTGDGLSKAIRLGAHMVDMEFFQFIPIAFVYPDSIKGYTLLEPLFYGTRHVDINGEPGHLYNNLGERFMKKYDSERMETATRDMIARSNYLEILEGRGTPEGGVWLKPDPKVIPDFAKRHPMYLKRLKENYGEKASRFEEAFQVTPSGLFTTGGIKIDENCRSSVSGFFAAGEVAGGIHGGNRLGGNSLIDIQVFGTIAGKNSAIHVQNISKQPHLDDGQIKKGLETIYDPIDRKSEIRPIDLKKKIQLLMWDCVGLARNAEGLERALNEFRKMQTEIIPRIGVTTKVNVLNREWQEYLEIRNMAELAEVMARCAIERTESRGAHYRQDFPQTDDENWRRNIVANKLDGKIELEIHPLVTL
jgi:succinate dehydrogenase / fumarate reductase flavoprotein subunit/fumarate reductase flavoprotein subunit